MKQHLTSKDRDDSIPIYVNKIDEMHEFSHEQKTLQNTPLQKYLSLAVYTTLIIVGLMYSQMAFMKERVRVSESKLDFVLDSFDEYKKSVTVLNETVCMDCHNTPDMMIKNLNREFENVEEFKKYVRVGGRNKNGIVMPPIPAESVDDYTLGKIWKVLK